MWKPILALMLLAAWLPATNHCLLETFPLFQSDNCCAAETSAPESNGHDCRTCSQVESLGYKFQKEEAVDFAAAMFVLALLPHLIFPNPQNGLPVEFSPEPEFSSSWQFALRTALPVRAPSLAS